MQRTGDTGCLGLVRLPHRLSRGSGPGNGWDTRYSHSGQTSDTGTAQYYCIVIRGSLRPSLMPHASQWSNRSLTPLRTNIIVTHARVKLTPRKQNLRLWPSHSLEPDNIKTGDFDMK